MADVADFAWDRFYVFPEYTSAEAISEATGLAYAPNDIQKHVREGMDLMVFVASGQPVCFIEFRSRGAADGTWEFRGFSYERGGLARESAAFDIKREGRGSILQPGGLPPR